MAKIKKEDGTFYYYYYQKKKGRHKKTGPKKKKKKDYDSVNRKTWDYKILQFDMRKQTAYIGKYHNMTEVSKKMDELKFENNKVEFPVRFVNNKRNGRLYDYMSEYVVLKRNNGDSNITLLRNDFGKLVENVVTDENWVVYDKIKHIKEETFWVYGYNPRTDRKTFRFVYENFVDNVIDDTYNLIQIYIYNNKVIFRYEYNEIEFVICKNTSDAIYMYNLLEEKYRGSRQVFFTGMTSGKYRRTNEIVSLIKNKTGWDLKKIYKKTTCE